MWFVAQGEISKLCPQEGLSLIFRGGVSPTSQTKDLKDYYLKVSGIPPKNAMKPSSGVLARVQCINSIEC